MEGVLQIEDDLLVHYIDQDHHDLNLTKIIDRLQEIRVTPRKEKCTWCAIVSYSLITNSVTKAC